MPSGRLRYHAQLFADLRVTAPALPFSLQYSRPRLTDPQQQYKGSQTLSMAQGEATCVSQP